ncbi:CHAT domain-containing protein [Pleurocapsa sp. PCC 7319]|uniref:CHAT domain-containing protein n=1 Tax=Pleurocapsa sp. PCC 7319 TaxID=118161 RepID=UPI00034BF1E3|nr:CHAT domain-containing protein [Pleurocapsa sp. PCC 7319]
MGKIFKFIAISLLGLSLTLAISVYIPVVSVAQSSQTINLVQKGINLFEGEQFDQAVNIWNTALDQEQEQLSRAFILSNLSLAYQNLGRWSEADNSIAKSLEILENLALKTQTYTEILAKSLNSKAHLLWLKGDFEQAIATWNMAADNYLEAGNQSQAINCELNQTKALQTLGLSSKAQEIATTIYQDLASIPSPEIKIRGLQHLGNVLRDVGNLPQSEQVLRESLDIAVNSDTLLELGNTERALSDSYLETNQPQLAEQYAQAAIAHYQEAFNEGKGNNFQAGLNQLSLAIAMGKWSQISPLLAQLRQSLDGLATSRAGIYARLNFARSLSCLKEITEQQNLTCVSKARRQELNQIIPSQKQPDIAMPDWEQIAQEIQRTIQQALDSKLKSYAIGELGKLYESQQKWQLAQKYTQQALLTLEGIQAPEIRYRWEWQLGRILKQQGHIEGAIDAYSIAINTLKSVRSDLLTVNSEVRFSFRDYTEPIYREFVTLLLQDNQSERVNQENLEQAIQSIDALQLAEVENFLNCDLDASLQLNLQPKSIDEINPNTAFIYPVILEDRLAVIFKQPGQSLEYKINPVDQETVAQTLQKLKIAVIRGYGSQVLSHSQVLYSWLIEPWEQYLEDSQQISTVVFILDGELRNIPMGVLYDAKKQEYLIEKHYALGLLPSFQVLDLQKTPSSELEVLGAGISEELQVEGKSFNRLEITKELAKIQNTISSSILLNAEFTQTNIQKNLDTEDYSIVHLATHGNFSSNPEETYILIYDSDMPRGSLLKARDLDVLLRHKGQKTPIELLVLSACETAEGDKRAALGLAGLAVRAGARSTLATLWQVSDQSTVKFMTKFYQELSVPGTSKAISLHRAQQALLKEPNFQAPYYWSPYVLVGNWL